MLAVVQLYGNNFGFNLVELSFSGRHRSCHFQYTCFVIGALVESKLDFGFWTLFQADVSVVRLVQ